MLRNNLNIYTLFILILVLLTGCNSSTQTSTYSLKGHVNLVVEGKSADNISVLLYHLSVPDADISALNSTNPGHGVLLNQRMMFDHRKAVPIYSTVTNLNGDFAINNIEAGVYNIVTYRDDVGYTYILDTEINNDIEDFQTNLYPIVILPGTIDNEYQMETGRVYQAASSIYINPSGNLIVRDDCSLLISPGATITIEGNLESSLNSSLSIRSADQTYTHSNGPNSIQRFSQINFNKLNDKELRNIYLSDSVYGINIAHSSNIGIFNSVFDSDYQSVVAQSCTSLTIERCIVVNSIDIARGALYIEYSSLVTVEKSFFKNNKNAIFYNMTTEMGIVNNYFISNGITDVYGGDYSNATIEYNTFVNSNTGVSNFSGQMVIDRNAFQSRVGIYNWRLNGSFSAQYNNLNCSEYGIKSTGWFHGTDLHPMTCTYNYWNTTNLSEIEALTYDRDNEDPASENYYLALTIVVFQPYQYSPNVAGIYN